MKLNNGKCEVIAMNKNNDIKFKDGTKLKHVREATYLGGKLTENTNASTEIQGRITECIPLMKALDTFRNKNKLRSQMEVKCVQRSNPHQTYIWARNRTRNQQPIQQT